GYYPTGVDHFGPRSMGHAPTATSAGYREMKKLRRETEAANYDKTRTLIFGRFRRANSSAPLWIGDPAVYAAIYSTNPSVNPFFPGLFEPGGACRLFLNYTQQRCAMNDSRMIPFTSYSRFRVHRSGSRLVISLVLSYGSCWQGG
ncbi:hypothetical protein FOZ62_002400, partial [Perkinsus olseni]